MADYEVDANMVRLVTVLNRFPGVSTFSSCGGHENPARGQAPAGEFMVSLDLDRDWNGWRSLEWIAWVISKTDDFDKVSVKTWISGDVPESMAFALDGLDGADPEALAKALEATLEELGL